jgi:CheY-like chemotaxis protein
MSQKILVVDDKPFMVRLIQHHLEKAGYTLIRARNQKEAMEAVQRESPNLVLVDDRSSSPGATSELVERNQKDAIPVIRISDVPPALAKSEAGPDAEVVLTKPFSPTQLISEVKRLIPESKCA